MAEDQGVNRDAWNTQAVNLLKMLGWESIGDANMDLTGVDKKTYGVDSLMCYNSPKIAIKQSCVFESKNYSSKSLNGNHLKDWIERLKQKLDMFCQSKPLQEKFSIVNESNVGTFNKDVSTLYMLYSAIKKIQ